MLSTDLLRDGRPGAGTRVKLKIRMIHLIDHHTVYYAALHSLCVEPVYTHFARGPPR